MKKKPARLKKSSSASLRSDEYAQQISMRLYIPQQLLLLCRLMKLSPQRLLIDFMDNLSQGSWKSEGRIYARELLKQYFITNGYGLDHYSTPEINSMFEELHAIGLLFPRNADPEMMDMHTSWRDRYHEYWYEKWLSKRK